MGPMREQSKAERQAHEAETNEAVSLEHYEMVAGSPPPEPYWKQRMEDAQTRRALYLTGTPVREENLFAAKERFIGKQAPGVVNQGQTTRDPWIHRSAGMLCQTCIFFVEKPTEGAMNDMRGPLGRCRRHAPTMSGYPTVFASDWCGDHKLDETKPRR